MTIKANLSREELYADLKNHMIKHASKEESQEFKDKQAQLAQDLAEHRARVAEKRRQMELGPMFLALKKAGLR
jgi:hypothetical protein